MLWAPLICLVCITGIVRADYMKTSTFVDGLCTGVPAYSSVNFPTGCIETGATTSQSLKCVNSSYGDYFAHYVSKKCAGAGQKISGANVTGGCKNGILTECISSPIPYNPPAMSISMSFFYTTKTCPGSLLGAGNTVETVYSYATDLCHSQGASSIKYTCNSTTSLTYSVYRGSSCEGTPAGAYTLWPGAPGTCGGDGAQGYYNFTSPCG